MSPTKHDRHLEALDRVAHLLTTLDLDYVLSEVIKITTDVTGASEGSFFLFDNEGNSLQRFVAARDLDPEDRSLVSHRVLETGLAGWVLTHKQGAVVQDTATDGRWVLLDDALRIRSAICVPIFQNREVIGVMTLAHPDPNFFELDDLRLAKTIANQASVAIRNAALYDHVQTQQSQLAALLNSASEALFAVDKDWVIRLMNPTAAAMVGVEPDSLIGRRLDNISDNPLYAELVERITQAQLKEGTQIFEARDEEKLIDYVVNVAVLRGEAPDEVGYAIALYDVTSLKDLNRLKTHMLRMASHDLKTPIALVIGYVDLVKKDVEQGVMPDLTLVDSINKAANRMQNMVKMLLDAHQSDETALKMQLIEPQNLIDTMLEDLLTIAQQRQQKIVLDVAEDMPKLRADFDHLREAMDNIFSNAIKYTPAGGTITIYAAVQNGRFMFNIKDTGGGIHPDEIPHLFKPYYRATQLSGENVDGTGVGLSLVKEVIERHGGKTWVESEVGEGSTFGFWIPILDANERRSTKT